VNVSNHPVASVDYLANWSNQRDSVALHCMGFCMGQFSEKQMTLGELVSALKRKDQDAWITFDFVHFRPAGGVHSYRGYYEDLAIGYESGGDTKVRDVVKWLEEANGQSFYGYKGGEYVMDSETAVWVANHNESGGTAIVDVVDDGWRIMLKTECVE
jgi:hypothetical protein